MQQMRALCLLLLLTNPFIYWTLLWMGYIQDPTYFDIIHTSDMKALVCGGFASYNSLEWMAWTVYNWWEKGTATKRKRC